MDHRELIKSLTAEQRIALTSKSDAIGLLHLASYLGTIAIVGVLIFLRVPFWPFLMVAQGILIVFLFTLMHEAMHRTVFASQWLNDGVGALCGFVLLLPPAWFRYFHFAHHRHTQDPENDPELATPKPETVRDYAIHVSGIPVWKNAVLTLLSNAFGAPEYDYVPASQRKVIQTEARRMLAGYVLVVACSLALQSTALIWLWIVPALLGQPFLRLFLLAEHGRCAFVANMLENSRTTFTTRFVRWLAWNMPYHAEHHALPTVPFHKLPEFHALTRKHLRETENGYTAFNRNYVEALQPLEK